MIRELPSPLRRRVYLYYEASLIKYSKVQQQQRTLMSIFCNSQALQKQATTPKQPELNNKCKIDKHILQCKQSTKRRMVLFQILQSFLFAMGKCTKNITVKKR